MYFPGEKKFQSKSLFFGITAFTFCGIVFCFLGMQKGWFNSKRYFFTDLANADGIRRGTPVEMMGIQVGQIEDYILDDENHIRTRISVYKKFSSKMREDTQLQLVRPFVIGEKKLYLLPGSNSSELLKDEAVIPCDEIFSVTDILNGKTLTPYTKTWESMLSELQTLVQLLLKEKGAEKFVKSLSGLPGALTQLEKMSKEMGFLAYQLSKDNRAENLIVNLNSVAEEMKKIAPEVPKSSRRLLEAIDEAVIVLKAMQKSFLLSSSAKEVREEEAAAAASKRKPASE
jgi:phospholipid/cholesterol/gamma-HCH transport system substrate-binding protein